MSDYEPTSLVFSDPESGKTPEPAVAEAREIAISAPLFHQTLHSIGQSQRLWPGQHARRQSEDPCQT
jgi:hypothetical protein